MAAARLWLALAVSVALTSCRQAPDPAKPALWEVTGPAGSHAWLFGTIHALPRPAAWRSAPIDAALAQADRIVVELDPRREGAGREFDILARTPDQPPLSTRVRPELRPPLAALLAKAGRSEADFAETETWAAALILARAGRDQDNANGIDRAVVALAGRRPVIELEGTRGQLGLFDSLPEAEQRDLLASVIADPQADGSSPAQAWRATSPALRARCSASSSSAR